MPPGSNSPPLLFWAYSIAAVVVAVVGANIGNMLLAAVALPLLLAANFYLFKARRKK